MKSKMVLVEWNDIAVVHGWVCIAEAREDEFACCQSVGFLIEDNDDKIILALSVSDYGNVFERQVIPREAIKSIKKLRVR